MTPVNPEKAQFLADAAQTSVLECIEWPWGCAASGYGLFWDGAGMRYAHSESCRLRRGTRPTGKEAAHHCGNRRCINGAHLFWKTPKQNAADKHRHGTDERPDIRGELSPFAVLTATDVDEIRNSPLSSRQIAPLYGVSHGHVRALRRRRKWRHI